VLAIVVV